jgi:iron complex outermembrane recepter protein
LTVKINRGSVVNCSRTQILARGLTHRLFLSIVVGCTLSGFAAHDAWAQQAQAKPVQGDDTLQEIVVTAEKRESTIQNTAISMSALSGHELESQGITTVEDLALDVPGLSIRTAGPGQTEYEIRGLTSAGGTSATVGFYLDEIPLSASATAQNGRTVIDPELFDLSNAEVLRGPQGTLYGAGSMGGTIKLVTNAPQLGVFQGATDLNTSDTARDGSANGGGSLMLNLPIGEIAALRIATTERYTSGWIDRVFIQPGDFPFPTNPAPAVVPQGTCLGYYCTRGNVESAPVEGVIKGDNLERFSSVRAAFLVKPSDQLSATASLMYQRIDADGLPAYQSPPSQQAIYQPYDIEEPYYDSFKLASLVLHYDFGPATVTSATGYWQRFVIQTQDSTEATENIFNTTQFIPNLYVEDDPTTQFSEELRVSSNGTGALQWVGGVYASDLHSTFIVYNQAAGFATAESCSPSGPTAGSCGPGGVLNNINNGGQAANPDGAIFNAHNLNVLKQYAVFGEVSYKFTDALKLTGGIRYFKFDVYQNSQECGVGAGDGNAGCQYAYVSGNGTAVLPKVNLAYTPTPDLTVYGNVAKGSRPGGVNIPIAIPSVAQLQTNPGIINCGLPLANQLNPSLPVPKGLVYVTSQPSYFPPDTVWSYELGEKVRFDDRRFSLNGDIYYTKWQQIQQNLTLSCGYLLNAPVGDGETYGPELEFSMSIVPGLTFGLSGTYNTAKITHPLASTGIAPGTKIVNVPQYTAMAELNYETPITQQIKGVFHLASSWIGDSEDAAYYRETLPSYDIVNARAGVASGPWAAYLTGTNLTNKIAELTINNTNFAWQQPTITRVSTNQPRTIGIDLQYKF